MSDGLCNKLLELKRKEKSETINVSFGVKSNVFCSFCLLFLSLVSLFHLHNKALPAAPRFMNSGHLSGRQRRMMGKWVFWWFTLGLPLYVAPVSSQTVLWFERKMPRGSLGGGFGGCCEVSARVVVLHLNRRHPEDGHASVSPWRQAEWQTHRGVGCCPAFCSPSLPRPHTTLRHRAPTCCHSATLEAASSTVCSVALRVQFSVCVLESSLYWLPGESINVLSVFPLVDLIQHPLTFKNLALMPFSHTKLLKHFPPPNLNGI